MLFVIGILLAGGTGSRLFPLTKRTSKQLLPLYDKPMIYYPLTTLMFAGVSQIFIIVSPSQLAAYEEILKDGTQWGLNIKYVIQDEPRGIADCFRLIPLEVRNQSCLVVLGDNIFYGMGLGASLKSAFSGRGALAFAYEVSKPNDYGVVILNEDKAPVEIVEKPIEFVSKYAIPGLYWFDSNCFEYAANIQPSARGELEITDVLKEYLNRKTLEIQILARGTAWLDTGTSKNLLSAANFVSVVEERQGLKIGCPEEVAFRESYIDLLAFKTIINEMPNGEYKGYLEGLIEKN